MISLEHVSKRYGDTVAVEDVTLEIAEGEIAVFVGPSGCGKTTTLKMINRLIEPTSGVIRINGRPTSEQDANSLRRSIGYVIQQVGLFPHMTIAENVATVPRLLGWDRDRIRRRVDELLDLVGLPPAQFAKRMPSELSGGQRQRVGVARALGADPPILLMDEPFGAIDPVTRDRLQDELLRLQSIVRKTVVFVTHDISEATKLGDRIILFSDRGHIAQAATPAELLASPASAFVREFLGDDRLVRRLGLIRLRETTIAPSVNGDRPSATVSVEGTLREALEAVLSAPDGRAGVVDGDKLVGVIDADAIRRFAQ
jgi:osmoprotectant transport system ATP-binding protein